MGMEIIEPQENQPPETQLPENQFLLPQVPQVPLLPQPEARPKTRWQRVLGWQYLGLCIIVVVTLVLHFAIITKPPTIVWDEVWYVGDARSIISRTGDVRPEHPPLAKLLMVAGDYLFNGFKTPEKAAGATTTQPIGSDSTTDNVIHVSDASIFTLGTTIRIDAEQMDIQSIDTTLNLITVKRGAGGTTVVNHAEQQPIYLFTDNAFEWRFFSIVFGTISIILFFFICRKLGMSQKATLFATFLFSFEDMSFVHASLALLDVYMVTFMLAAFLLYLHKGYWLSGMSMALSALCKLTGFFAFIAIFLHWLFFRRDRPKWFLSSILVTGLSFLAFLIFFDYFANGRLENPIQRTLEMLNLSAANVFTNPPLSISSRPWEWLLPWKWIIYSYDPQYISFISWTVQILIIPIIIYMIYKASKGNNIARFGLLWFIATYLIWIPLELLTNRVSFVFYFYPTIPAICIGIGLALSDIIDKLKAETTRLGRVTAKVRANYVGIGLYLAFHLALFIVFNPAVPVLIKLWLPPFAS